MALVLTSAPGCEPITTDEAKTHLVVDHTNDDAYITGLIVAVRRQVENYLRRALITQTWRLTLDAFPNDSLTPIELPLPALQSVSSITYTDVDGVTQTWSSSLYTVDADSQPGRVIPAYGESWPETRDVINAVKITFVAGYGDTEAEIPADIVHAMKLLLSHYYDNREAVSELNLKEIPLGFKSLLYPNRVFTF